MLPINGIDAMLDAGAYVGVASHDYPVVNHTIAALESRGMVQTNQILEKMLTRENKKARGMNSKCC